MDRSRLLVCAAFALTSASLAQNQGPEAPQAALAADLVQDGFAVRWDFETGTLARITWPQGPAIAGTAQEAARLALEETLRPFLDPTVVVATNPAFAPLAGPVLVADGVRDLGNDRQRVDYQQRAGAYPVLHSGISIEVAFDGEGWRPRIAQLRYFPGIPAEATRAPSPEVEAGLLERFPSYESQDFSVETTVGRTVIPTATGFRAAFAVTAFEAPITSWQIHVDAETGEEINRFPVSCTAVVQGQVYDKNPGVTPRAMAPLQRLYVNQGNDRETTDLLGTHPLTGMVSLEQGLAGPLTRVFVSGGDELNYTGPADIQLSPQEAAAAQDELAAFHNLVDFNRHLQAIYDRFKGSTAASTRFALSVRYQQNGQPVQNAFFTPQNVNAGGESFTGLIAMGTFGNREAARSSSVCQHEYCHALFSEIVQLSGSEQAGGLNEGLADYLPSAFKDDPEVGGWLVGGAIRDLRRKLVWPADRNGEVHRAGHIFAGALWRARTAAEQLDTDGRLAIDQAVVEGLFRLNNQPDLVDARDAVLEGDQAANNGAYRVTLSNAFNEHGIGPAAQNDAPTLDPIPAQTVKVGETLEIQLTLADPDADPLRVGFSTLANATYDEATETLSFRPDATQVGQHSVTLTASDEEFSDSQTVDIDVEAATPVPAPLTGSTTTPAATQTAGANGPAPSGRSGGGGGGCSLGSPASGGGLWVLALLTGLVAVRRRG